MIGHMHPVEGIRGQISHRLSNKRILLGITGSIAAVQCFELARDLIRHGADVEVVMSEEATKIVAPYAMEFATGHLPITRIGGGVEHVDLCGESEDRVDLLMIAPCTANTISKMALGIDDTPVTTFATTAIGTGIPVLVAPAMHGSMYRHPIVQKNLQTLEDIGVEVIGPRFMMGKAKIASNGELVARALRALGPGDLSGKRLLVIGGSSEEPIDGMRIITNKGTGETAVELASAAFERGADVELWMGRHQTELPDYLEIRRFLRLRELEGMVENIDHDLVMVPAALSDYAPEEAEGKIPTSEEELVLRLTPMPKLLSRLSRGDHRLVGFKAERGITEDQLSERARSRLKEYGLDLIVANDLTKVSRGKTEVMMISKSDDVTRASGTKREVADSILDEVLKVLV
jgi:phosphopantothenoylcysteine decarboxylase/phosphopantothenate--cysteine ligase